MDPMTELHVRLAVAENELFHARFEAHCAREANRYLIESLPRTAATQSFAGHKANANEELQVRLAQAEQESRDLRERVQQLLEAQKSRADTSAPTLQRNVSWSGEDWAQGRVSSGRTPSPPPFYTNKHEQVENIYQSLVDATDTDHPQMFKITPTLAQKPRISPWFTDPAHTSTATGRAAYNDWDAEPKVGATARAGELAYSEHAETPETLSGKSYGKDSSPALAERSEPLRQSHGPTLDLLEGRVTSMFHRPHEPQGTKDRTLISYAESADSDDNADNNRLAQDRDAPDATGPGLNYEDDQEEVRQSVEHDSDGEGLSGEDTERASIGTVKQQERQSIAQRPILKPVARLHKNQQAATIPSGTAKATDPVDDLATRFSATSFNARKKYSGAAEFDLEFGGDGQDLPIRESQQVRKEETKEGDEHDEDSGSEEGEIVDARMASLPNNESAELDY